MPLPTARAQPPGRPVSALVTVGILAREIAVHGLGWALRPRRRDRTQVQSEYDRGVWRRLAEDRPWRDRPTLEEYVNPSAGPLRVATVENRYVHIASRDYYVYRTHIITDVFRAFATDEPELVELGCGSGFNIFLLLTAGASAHFTGLDVSPHALRAARDIRRHFGLEERTAFHELDLLEGSHPNYHHLTDRVVFTYYCLEQLKYDTRRVLEHILAARPRRVLHFEPTVELLRLWDPRDLVNYLYIKRQDYQDNLVTTLRAMEREGRLRVVTLARLHYAPGPRHDPTLIVWQPLRQQ